MKRAQCIGIATLILLLVGSTFAQQETETITLSLKGCIIKAMENNLGVAIEVLNPELAEISVDSAREKFLPDLSFSYNRRDNNSASYSFLDAAETVSSLYYDYGSVFNQAIPTGGSFSVSINTYKSESNRSFQSINPRFGSTLTFEFTQPLLKNFGYKNSRKDIIVANNNLAISEKDFETALQDTVYSVEEAYWNLVYSQELLKVRQQSLELARDLLEKNQRAVEVGTLAPIEILNAQATVATREADILDAEAQVKNNEDILKTRINLAAEEEGAEDMTIIPADRPGYERNDVRLQEALSIAMKNRPDLQAARIDLKNQEINFDFAKNQMLPDLSLRASYFSPGISGNQILYQDNNAFSGIVVGVIPGGISNALKDAFNFRYKNWSIGLTLSVPFNTFLSRAAYAQSRVNLEQSQLRLKNQEQQIFLEIKTAVRAVQTNYKRVLAYRAARELSQRQLEAEEEKLKVGLTTNYFVLQYQTDLATAQSTELKALIDYNLSLANLNRVLGTSLEEKSISTSAMLGN